MNQDIYYQAKDAARLMSSTPSDVARLGQVIQPDIPADGRGYRSFYSFRNLVEMRLGEELVSIGISWKRISKYIEALRKSHGRWLDEDGLDGWLVLDRLWRWGAGTTLEMAMDAVFKDHSRTLVIAVNIGLIKQAIRRKTGDDISDEAFKEIREQIEQDADEFNRISRRRADEPV